MPANIYKNKDGERVPGTTTIISKNLGWNKQALMAWANRMGLEGHYHYDVSGDAAQIGTIAHAMVEAELKSIEWQKLVDMRSVEDEQVEQAMTAFNGFLKWRDLFKFELVHSEHLLVSEKYQYGGQIDISAIQGNLSLIDLKTSNDIYPDHVVQLAAYDNLWNENNPDNLIKNHFILRIGKQGGFAYYDLSESQIKYGFEVFTIARRLHDLEKLL